VLGGQAAARSLLIVELFVAVRNVINIVSYVMVVRQFVFCIVAPRMFPVHISNALLRVMCPIVWSGLNQIWIFSTDFNKSFQYQTP
jgi:hypothetical protein